MASAYCLHPASTRPDGTIHSSGVSEESDMKFELKAVTEPGRRLVEIAEGHATDFATRTDQHDRENSFPFENMEALQKSGMMAACVPEEFGGLGV